ncbi:hypothetical protein HPB52_025042 [Rhipicephalus sanguineus]|uniref:Tetraspanin n=1 Tax=Rhipicephalus sanguineus TaxID=34632 RepID=A0A9D4TDI8_RHISA|nr:hypothetical protein HPB52_025042 [Rhipicephalus sanguineus]
MSQTGSRHEGQKPAQCKSHDALNRSRQPPMQSALKKAVGVFAAVLLMSAVAMIAVGSHWHGRLSPYSNFFTGRLGTPIILIVMACEIAAAVASFEYRHVIGAAVRSVVVRDLDGCQGTGLEFAQRTLACCGGPNGSHDYRARGLAIPPSCCPRGCQGYGAHRASCDYRLEGLFNRAMIDVGSTAIALLCIRFMGVLRLLAGAQVGH